MKKLLLAAAVAGALGVTGCASTAPHPSPMAKNDLAAAKGIDQETTRTGSRLEKRPARSQPVKGISAPDWKTDVEGKPQPMPAGNER